MAAAAGVRGVYIGGVRAPAWRDLAQDPAHVLERYKVEASDLLRGRESDDSRMREALVYWRHPDLDEAQKRQILRECSKEVDEIRELLILEGNKILQERNRQRYENYPWLFKKMTDLGLYLRSDSVRSKCKVCGTALLIVGIAVFFCQKVPSSQSHAQWQRVD